MGIVLCRKEEKNKKTGNEETNVICIEIRITQVKWLTFMFS